MAVKKTKAEECVLITIQRHYEGSYVSIADDMYIDNGTEVAEQKHKARKEDNLSNHGEIAGKITDMRQLYFKIFRKQTQN